MTTPMIWQGHPLMRFGRPAMGEACCCEEEGEVSPCPDECPDCPGTLTFTIAGWGGALAEYNGDYVIDKIGAGPGECIWTDTYIYFEYGYAELVLSIECLDSGWIAHIATRCLGSECCEVFLNSVSRPNLTGCPPMGEYVMEKDSDFPEDCSNVPTVTISSNPLP